MSWGIEQYGIGSWGGADFTLLEQTPTDGSTNVARQPVISFLLVSQTNVVVKTADVAIGGLIRTNGTIQVTTIEAESLVPGEQFTLLGSTDINYPNGTYIIQSVIDAFNFTYVQGNGTTSPSTSTSTISFLDVNITANSISLMENGTFTTYATGMIDITNPNAVRITANVVHAFSPLELVQVHVDATNAANEALSDGNDWSFRVGNVLTTFPNYVARNYQRVLK